MDLGLSGLASGFDWRAFVDQMVEVERAPQQRLREEQNTVQQKKIAYSSIKTQLAVLQSRVDALKDPALFDVRNARTSDDALAAISASPGTPLGKFDFNFSQLATAARFTGTDNIGSALSASGDVSGVMLSDAGLARPITAGTFTVNGAQITVDPSASLQDVFAAIATATGGNVSAIYDPAADAVTLSSANGELVLGSATDSSNFLSALKLYNNGTNATSSSAALGGVKRTAALVDANLTTAIDDGGSGAGIFKINGVEITFDASTDSLSNVITRINDSDAGVSASYDQANDRLVLTNKETGDIGISIQDVTGNFAVATGLATGTLEHGKNLLYSVNGGGTQVATSNTITEENGLSITALGEGSVTVTVGSDTSKIKTAIQDFITEYNKAQSLIETNTANSTDSKGAVTSGTLSDESDASAIGSRLRATAFATISGFGAAMDQLADLGITTNGSDNSLKLENEEALDAALANNLSGVRKLFTDSTNGLAVKLAAYLEKTNGDDGTLAQKDAKLVKDVASIDTQVSDLERIVQSNKQALIERFVQMETAQAQINQQLQFLMQRFGGGSS